MNVKRIMRWSLVAIAVPVGAVLGYYVGAFLCLGVLTLQNRGDSHNDMYTIIAIGILGVILGMVFLPFWVSRFTRRLG